MLHLYKGKVQIDKESLPKCPSIHKIVEEFKVTDSLMILKYIFLMYDRTEMNPLAAFPISERSLRARKIAFGDSKIIIKKLFPKDVKLITSAIKEYEGLIDKIQRDIDLYDKKMYQFINLLKDNKPEIIKNTHDISGRVTFSTNIDIITTILDNSINIILDKAVLTLMKKTGKFSNELRGSLSPNIKGKLTNKE